MSRYESRRQKLRRQFSAQGIDGLLVTYPKNVTYLTGFTGDDSYLLLGRKGELLISDGRFTTQLAEECPGLEVSIRGPGRAIVDQVAEAVASFRLRQPGFESEALTCGQFGRIEAKTPNVAWRPQAGLVESQRAIKDKEELEAIRLAVRHAEKAFACLRASVRPELTEKQLCDELEANLRRFGAQGSAFPPIVAVGPRAALPHASPGEAVVGSADLLLVDWGATSRHYRSDLTRVLLTGKMPPKLERVYGVVLKAQQAAIAAIRPGVATDVVDRAARTVIEQAGFGRFFNHSIGHGIGLDIHEAPRMSLTNQQPLEAGMVVTVEPGIYLPGWGGVRIEDDILVTRDGHEVLTAVPRQLADMVVA